MTRLLHEDDRNRVTLLTTLRNAPAHASFEYAAVKNDVLGKTYDLSLTFIGPVRMRRLNRTHRDTDTATDILSFTINDTTGEIFICPAIAQKKAPAFGYTTHTYMAYLFIHGCLHLKGMRHGRTMEHEEARLLAAYGV